MAKLRSVSTSFWSDPWIEELSPSEKLLYIYFITNEKTNMLGIYEVSIKKICFETGLNKDVVLKSFDTFKESGKIKYEYNYIILVNFIKHQNYNPNMKKAAIDCYNNLPKELKIKDLNISKLNPLEAFETLSNHLGMVRKVEVEYEVEDEEIIDVFSFDEFWEIYPHKTGKKVCKPKFDKLTNSEKEQIKNSIHKFLNHKPFPNYTHPNPETYLNQKRWEDVIPETINQPEQREETEREYRQRTWLERNGGNL
jgi:hypothetical protein